MTVELRDVFVEAKKTALKTGIPVKVPYIVDWPVKLRETWVAAKNPGFGKVKLLSFSEGKFEPWGRHWTYNEIAESSRMTVDSEQGRKYLREKFGPNLGLDR